MWSWLHYPALPFSSPALRYNMFWNIFTFFSFLLLISPIWSWFYSLLLSMLLRWFNFTLCVINFTFFEWVDTKFWICEKHFKSKGHGDQPDVLGVPDKQLGSSSCPGHPGHIICHEAQFHILACPFKGPICCFMLLLLEFRMNMRAMNIWVVLTHANIRGLTLSVLMEVRSVAKMLTKRIFLFEN